MEHYRIRLVLEVFDEQEKRREDRAFLISDYSDNYEKALNSYRKSVAGIEIVNKLAGLFEERK